MTILELSLFLIVILIIVTTFIYILDIYITWIVRGYTVKEKLYQDFICKHEKWFVYWTFKECQNCHKKRDI